MNDINSSVKAMWFKLKLDKIHLAYIIIHEIFKKNILWHICNLNKNGLPVLTEAETRCKGRTRRVQRPRGRTLACTCRWKRSGWCSAAGNEK